MVAASHQITSNNLFPRFVINEFLNNSRATRTLAHKYITKLSYFICTNSSFLNYKNIGSETEIESERDGDGKKKFFATSQSPINSF